MGATDEPLTMANQNNINHEDGAVIHIDTDDEEPINIDSDAENNIDSDAENNVGSDGENHIDSDVENNIGSDAENNIGSDGGNHVGSDAENHVGSDAENHIESISIDSDSDASMNSGAEMQNNCHSRSDSGSDNQSYSNSDEASGSDIDGQCESGSDDQYHNNISGEGSTSGSQRSCSCSDHHCCSDSSETGNSEYSDICVSEDDQSRIDSDKRSTKSIKQSNSDSNDSRSDLEEDNYSDSTSYTIGSNESHLSKSASDNDDVDDCSGCYENHQHVYSSYKPNFSLRIANILRGYGDGPAPKDDTVLMVEKIVVQQMRALINDLIRISDRTNGYPDPKQSDFEFLMRRSPNKIARLRKYIRDMEFRSRYREMMNGKLPRNVANIAHMANQSNVNKQPTGEAYDEEVIRRLVRADRISDILHGEDYLEYSDARKTSFHWRNFGDAKNLLKVLNIPTNWEFSSMVYAILGYLVHETIHTLVDYAILTRLNSKNLRKDPLERLIPEGN